MTPAVFARALLDPDAAIPAGIIDPMGRPAPKRFSVYRNNVASSLTRALEAAFPTVRKLVGDEFFGAMAVVFLRIHPPQSRMLMLYGDDMSGFLENFQPVAHLGYLPDVARLDQAMRQSYHAADSIPMSVSEIQQLAKGDISGFRLRLAPALRLVKSSWPIQSIWAANADGGPTPRPGPETALVMRPDFDPRPHCLSEGGGALVQGLLDGLTLGQSLENAEGPVDLPAVLSLLISGKAITGVSA